VRRCLLLLLACLAAAPAAQAAELAKYVDPKIGTFAPGFTLPGPVVPFGMLQQSPDTLGPLVYSGYMAHDAAIRGFSLVHLSGPGVAKAGDLPFMPWTGPGPPPSDPQRYAQPFERATEEAQAGYYRVLLGNGVDVDLTTGLRAGMQRYAFPAGRDAYLVVNPRQRNSGATQGGFTQTGPNEIAGWTKSRYPVYFVARFDAPIEEAGEHWVRFAAGRTVTMRVGISFVDEEGARRNLAGDAPDGLTFAKMRAAAYEAWDDQLSRVRVEGGTPADLRTFYTALYHSLLHPNVFSDADGRYRGFDDQVHDAGRRVQYANFSSWDTYKSTNQLQALLVPDRYADMLRSLLADAQQGGRLPRWGEQNVDAAHMSGDPAVPMIADGICRGLLGADETRALYEKAVELRSYRDPALDRLGYLPGRPGTTLEYGIADFALALIAKRLGRDEEAQRWLAASLSYRKLLDENGWVAPRDADGRVPAGFDPTLADQGFQEGNSWQYTWLVPQDAGGLLKRIDATVTDPGDLTAEQRLDTLFSAPAEAQNRGTFFGVYYTLPQWAPGNEHDLGAPWMYAYLGQQWKIAEVLRDANTLYRPTPDGLPGNDDLGGLSAWYAWSAMGLVPPTPGAPLHLVGSPVFESVSIARNRGAGRFRIEAPGASPAAMYVQSATLNGKPLERSWFADGSLRPGGVLRLEMGPLPNRDWGAKQPPPSASDASLEEFACVP